MLKIAMNIFKKTEKNGGGGAGAGEDFNLEMTESAVALRNATQIPPASSLLPNLRTQTVSFFSSLLVLRAYVQMLLEDTKEAMARYGIFR